MVDAILGVARFWLEKGVDGFRCDVIGYLYESNAGCDGLPETHAYSRRLRDVLDEFSDRAMVAESTSYLNASQYFGNGGRSSPRRCTRSHTIPWSGSGQNKHVC